jgi:hypothetical protein
MPKFVIAARHPGAARGAVSIAQAALQRNIGVEFLATDPAFSILAATGLAPVLSFKTARQRYPTLPEYDGCHRIHNDQLKIAAIATPAIEKMAAWLTRYLEQSQPDAVLMTDANEQLGVEQIIAIAASHRRSRKRRCGEGPWWRFWRARHRSR